jgi:hypothetical protein
LTPCSDDGKVYTRSREGRGDEEDPVGKDQFGDGGTRRIPKEKIEKAKEKPPADTTKKPEKTDKD